jgi:hypothetical protein
MNMEVLTVKQLILFAVALTLISSCGGDGNDSGVSESVRDDSNQTNQPQADQTGQTSDDNQEGMIETVTFGGSTFGYTKFQ